MVIDENELFSSLTESKTCFLCRDSKSILGIYEGGQETQETTQYSG